MIFNRFTRETRACVEAAVEEARLLGHDTVGDEDLLMGVLRNDEGIGAAALSSLGVTLEGVQGESEQMFSAALTSIGISMEQVRRGAGEAFEMRVPDNRCIPFSPGRKRRWSRRSGRRCGSETAVSGRSTSCWEYRATGMGWRSG